MLASCFVLEPVPPVLELVAVATTVFVVVAAVNGPAEVTTTFEATVLVAVFEEAVGAAEVTTCCCCGCGCGCWVVVAELVADPAVLDGGVAVVMVEF